MITSSAVAQEFRIGATAGLELSNMLIKDNEETYSDILKSKAGLKIGVIGEYSFNDYFALASELAFVQRGTKAKESQKEENWSFSGKNKININYLQIPINAKLSYPINDNFSIFGFAGPYVAFALSGKISAEYTETYYGETESDKISEKIKFGSNEGEDYLKRFDFGLNFGVGTEYKGCFLKAQYDLGLSNISVYSEEGAKIKNRNFGISIGYMFGF